MIGVKLTRMLVLSDIHSNYTALKTVLDNVEPFEAVLFTGDIVGFGPHPNECVNVIRKLDVKSVIGNHDHAIIRNDFSSYPVDVGKADLINRSMITPGNLEWVRSQPETFDLEIDGLKVSLIHANSVTPLMGYVHQRDAIKRSSEFKGLTGADLLILGHTHRPYIHRRREFTILNPGSVGIPRDESRASFMYLDIEDGEFDVVHTRVEYDYDANADAMSKLGLPEQYVERMWTGPVPRT